MPGVYGETLRGTASAGSSAVHKQNMCAGSFAGLQSGSAIHGGSLKDRPVNLVSRNSHSGIKALV